MEVEEVAAVVCLYNFGGVGGLSYVLTPYLET